MNRNTKLIVLEKLESSEDEQNSTKNIGVQKVLSKVNENDQLLSAITEPVLSRCSCNKSTNVEDNYRLESSKRATNLQDVSTDEKLVANEFMNLRQKLFKLQESYNKLREISQKLSEGVEYKLTSPLSTENDNHLRQTLNELSEKLTEFDNDVITIEIRKNHNVVNDSNSKKESFENNFQSTKEDTIQRVTITEYSSVPPPEYPSWLAITKTENVSPPNSLFEKPSKLILSSIDIEQPGESNESMFGINDSPQKLLKKEPNGEMKSLTPRGNIPKSTKNVIESDVSTSVDTIAKIENVILKTSPNDTSIKDIFIPKDLQTRPLITEKLMQKSTSNIICVPKRAKPSIPFPEHITECNYFQIDYPKIICDLKVGSTYLQLRIFQALRWRLTHASLDMRDKVIKQYVSNDIFGLMDYSKHQKTSTVFLSHFYFPRTHKTPHLIQQNIARFVNAVASLTTGRNYLTHDTTILQNILLRIVMPTEQRRGFNFDTITKEMVLATLQKFSLRNTQRLCMFSEGLVEYLIQTLYEKGKYYSMYRLEYATALLMNLCLHKEAQNRCALLIPTVIELFVQLLDSKYSPCLLYVNGTIYSLFMNQNILNYAKNAGIANLIKLRSKQCEGEVQQQLKFLYKFMTDSNFAKTKRVSEPSNHAEDEIDLIEPEIEMFDNLTNIYGNDVFVGEVLLHDRYFSEAPTPKLTIREINSLPGENINNKQITSSNYHISEKFITESTSTKDLIYQKTASVQVNYLIDNPNQESSSNKNQQNLNDKINSILLIDNAILENDNVNFEDDNRSKIIIYVTDQEVQTDDSDNSIDQFTQTLPTDNDNSSDLSPNNNEEQTYKDHHRIDDKQNERKHSDNNMIEKDTALNLSSISNTKHKKHDNQIDNTQNEKKYHDYNVKEKDIELNLSPISNNKKQMNRDVKKHIIGDKQREKKHSDNNVIEKDVINEKLNKDAKKDNYQNEKKHIDNNVKEKEHKLSSKFKQNISKKQLKSKLSPLLDHNNVSFNEQTKQFYKKPTKLAIFERKKPHPPFTSTKPPTANRRTTSASTPKNTFTIHTCQFYPDNSKSPYSESTIYNPPFALDFYDRLYPNEKSQCRNCENSPAKPSNSEMKLLNDCMHKDRRKFLPKLFNDPPFRCESEQKIPISHNDTKISSNPYTHFSKNTCGNYSILNFLNTKPPQREQTTRKKPTESTASTVGGSTSRKKSNGLPKNPFISRPKLPRTPPLSNHVF